MARPATGQTPVKTFRPPGPLWKEIETIAAAEGRANSELVIEALHDLVKKKHRERATKSVAKPAATPPDLGATE